MNGHSSTGTKRKRSVGPNDLSRPPPYQPDSPGTLWGAQITSTDSDRGLQDSIALGPRLSQNLGNDRSVNVAASWTNDSITSVSVHQSPTGVISKFARLQLSDQDSDLLSFDNAPPVASGGSCELYIAVHRPTNLKLAMKRLRLNFPTDDMLRRFRREAEIWSTFRHPNILPFFGAMKIHHRIYIASPWMFLGDLLAFVQTRINLVKQGRWKPDGSMLPAYRNFNEANIIQEIAAGLAHLHSIHVVHGDMKAKNVLLNDEGHAQICDFGLTKTLSHSVTSTELKGVGSTRWQSPELLQNAPKSASSDVYAFGMTISEILTGNYPFPNLREQTAVIFAVMLRNERPECQPHLFLGVDFEPLWMTAASCWEAKPEDRPRIKEVLQRLTLAPPNRAIHRLTPDIFQHIFKFVYGTRRYGVSCGTDLGITLSHVCQSWRLAATKSPSLWSKIWFNGSFPFNLQSLQIERSEGVSIIIAIQGKYSTQQTNQLIRLLRPHVTRWKSLELAAGCFNNNSFCLFFDELHHEYAPMLETLHAYDYYISNWEWGSQPFSRGTPRLVNLAIGHYQLYRNAGLFSHLTNLFIAFGYCFGSCWEHTLGPQDLLTIFAQCASTIRSVDIHIPSCIHIEGPNPLPNPISLPHLTELDLHDNDPLDDKTKIFISKIYSQITAPKIQSHFFWVSELELFASPAAFPFPNLTCLEIRDYSDELRVDNPQLMFKHIFDQLPQLRELKVDNVTRFDPRILESTCIGLRKFSWTWYLVYQPAPEFSVFKDVIELRQLRARERGTRDSLVEVRCKLWGVKLSKEDHEWLESHLELFDFSYFD